MQRLLAKKTGVFFIVAILLSSTLLFIIPSIEPVYAADSHKRIKLAKHIVNGSGVTKEKFEEWIAEANTKWNCSLIIEDGDPDVVNETDIGTNRTAGRIDVYGVSADRGIAGNYYGACWDQQRIEVCNDSKLDTLAHEIGHWFGLDDVSDPNDLMYSGCNRTGNATVPAINQTLVRENASMWLNNAAALTCGQAKAVKDATDDVPPEAYYFDIDWVESFFDVSMYRAYDYEVLRASVSFDVATLYDEVDGEVGVIIESDGDPATGQPPDGIDYAVYVNPLHDQLHFERYDSDIGWVPLDPTGITFDHIYYYPDHRDPEPTLPLRQAMGISFAVPEPKLARGGGGGARKLLIRGYAADIYAIDWAPDPPEYMELTMYMKPPYPDYAQSGVPDFDQRQSNWFDPASGAWSWCGPIAVANSLSWMDSRFEPNPISTPTVNDGYPLVTAYGPWDDHDPQNLDPFANNLAWLMDTDGMRTGIPHSGTTVWDMQTGIDNYLIQQGLGGLFYENTLVMPTFEEIVHEVEKCEDVILLLGFWQDQGGPWVRIGGHYVTVAGIDSTNRLIALSDPIQNNAEPPPEGTSGPGRVLPGPHGPPYPHSTDMHNDSAYISHDIYTVTSSPSPGNPDFGLPEYNVTFENFWEQNFDPGDCGPYLPGLPVFTEVEYAVTISPYDWYFKGWPKSYVDYAPSGVPDFDQRQWGSYNWTNPYPPIDQWSHCGPTAVANSLSWLDSQFEPYPVSPPVINDNFALVESYDPTWDDHDPQNVPYLIEDLAYLMDTNGIRTGIPHCGTKVMDMQQGIDEYLHLKGLDWKFYEHTVKMPTYDLIVEEILKSQDVTLLLGFWQTADGVTYWRIGGHYVTVAGVDASTMRIAFSDPIADAAEFTGNGHVAPPPVHPHSPVPPHQLHNDALFVSHDIYTVATSPSPGGIYGLTDYWVIDELGNVFGSCQNFPDDLLQYEGEYDPQLQIYTEIEYAVIVSCKTGIVAAGCEDTNVYAWDFYGSLQWQWAVGLPVVSVSMDNGGRFVAAGTRANPDPYPPGTWGDLWLFDNSLGSAPGNILWMNPGVNVSTSYDGGWMGTESKSVDVKYNEYNGYVVVAAATDQGLMLFDEFGSQAWHYSDGWAETIVRISQDGNYIVCADHLTDEIHYFSHLYDGIPGWGPTDGTPVWSFSGGMIHDFLHIFWVAISGLGDYVAVGGYDATPPLPYTGEVFLLDKTGNLVWSHSLPKGQYVRVDMPCHGRSVVAVNDDPLDLVGCDLSYWSDGGNGWDAGDSMPIWSYWPTKETGGGQNPLHDYYTVAISENGDYVAAGGLPPSTFLLTKGGTLTQTVPATAGHTVQSVDLTFTGKYGASGDSYGVVTFFDKDTGFLWNRNTDLNLTIHSIAVSKIYPCMFPFPYHDLAVIDVVPDKNQVAPGDTVSVTVTVENKGDFVESFFDVYLEVLFDGMPQTGVVPPSVTVPLLSSGAQIDVIFSWGTTGFAEENYTLIAKATIVQDEIYVYDNTCIDGVIEVESGLHDVAVIDVKTCKQGCLPMQTVGKGYTAHINVTVSNLGDFDENITINAYANLTLVGTASIINLAPTSQTTVTLLWNTSTFAHGNYTISANATAVPGEGDLSNNAFSNGIVRVVVPGNIDANNIVNMLDLYRVALHFGATPGTPNWDPNCDVDDNHIINMLDLYITALNFGKIDPPP